MGYLDKIVSLYHLDNNATDAIGSNDGGEVNAAYTVDAAIGSHAFDGDGVDKRTNIGNDSSLDITNAISLGGLIKPNSVTGHSVKSAINKVNGYYLGIGFPTTNEYGFAVHVSGGFRSATASGIGLDTSNYHAIIGTYDGTNIKIFVDKILRGIAIFSGSITSVPSNDVVLFANGFESGGFLNAKGDESFIGNDYLTDGGVTILGNTATGEVAEVTDRLLAGIPLDAVIGAAGRRRRMLIGRR